MFETSMNIGEFLDMFAKYPRDKEFLFEDDSGRLFGFTSFREKPGDKLDGKVCHFTLELTELDKEATFKMCDD